MIAREGWTRIVVFAVLALGVQLFAGIIWALPFWLLLLLVIQFFRDPDREIPQQPGAIVSPAHGRVVAIERVLDPYVNQILFVLSFLVLLHLLHFYSVVLLLLILLYMENSQDAKFLHPQRIC